MRFRSLIARYVDIINIRSQCHRYCKVNKQQKNIGFCKLAPSEEAATYCDGQIFQPQPPQMSRDIARISHEAFQNAPCY